MKSNLTIKERRFLEKYLQGRPLYECAKHYGCKGNNRESLTVRGCQILGNLSISMEETLNLGGITDEFLREKMSEGLEAKKKYYGTWQGNIIESKPYNDIPTRMKALEIAGRMKGLFIDKVELTGKDGGDITLMINPSKGKKGAGSVKMGLD